MLLHPSGHNAEPLLWLAQESTLREMYKAGRDPERAGKTKAPLSGEPLFHKTS